MVLRLQTVARRFLSSHPPVPNTPPIVLVPRFISEEGKKYLEEEKAKDKAHEESGELWEKISWYIGMPSILLSIIYSYKLLTDHLRHLEEHPPKFIPYSHLRIRNKKFCWGDGDHTLFHNPLVNPDPEEE